jgi:hypothetical protein
MELTAQKQYENVFYEKRSLTIIIMDVMIHTPVIPALGRQRQGNHEFQVIWDSVARSI